MQKRKNINYHLKKYSDCLKENRQTITDYLPLNSNKLQTRNNLQSYIYTNKPKLQNLMEQILISQLYRNRINHFTKTETINQQLNYQEYSLNEAKKSQSLQNQQIGSRKQIIGSRVKFMFSSQQELNNFQFYVNSSVQIQSLLNFDVLLQNQSDQEPKRNQPQQQKYKLIELSYSLISQPESEVQNNKSLSKENRMVISSQCGFRSFNTFENHNSQTSQFNRVISRQIVYDGLYQKPIALFVINRQRQKLLNLLSLNQREQRIRQKDQLSKQQSIFSDIKLKRHLSSGSEFQQFSLSSQNQKLNLYQELKTYKQTQYKLQKEKLEQEQRQLQSPQLQQKGKQQQELGTSKIQEQERDRIKKMLLADQRRKILLQNRMNNTISKFYRKCPCCRHGHIDDQSIESRDESNNSLNKKGQQCSKRLFDLSLRFKHSRSKQHVNNYNKINKIHKAHTKQHEHQYDLKGIAETQEDAKTVLKAKRSKDGLLERLMNKRMNKESSRSKYQKGKYQLLLKNFQDKNKITNNESITQEGFLRSHRDHIHARRCYCCSNQNQKPSTVFKYLRAKKYPKFETNLSNSVYVSKSNSVSRVKRNNINHNELNEGESNNVEDQFEIQERQTLSQYDKEQFQHQFQKFNDQLREEEAIYEQSLLGNTITTYHQPHPVQKQEYKPQTENEVKKDQSKNSSIYNQPQTKFQNLIQTPQIHLLNDKKKNHIPQEAQNHQDFIGQKIINKTVPRNLTKHNQKNQIQLQQQKIQKNQKNIVKILSNQKTQHIQLPLTHKNQTIQRKQKPLISRDKIKEVQKSNTTIYHIEKLQESKSLNKKYVSIKKPQSHQSFQKDKNEAIVQVKVKQLGQKRSNPKTITLKKLTENKIQNDRLKIHQNKVVQYKNTEVANQKTEKIDLNQQKLLENFEQNDNEEKSLLNTDQMGMVAKEKQNIQRKENLTHLEKVNEKLIEQKKAVELKGSKIGKQGKNIATNINNRQIYQKPDSIGVDEGKQKSNKNLLAVEDNQLEDTNSFMHDPSRQQVKDQPNIIQNGEEKVGKELQENQNFQKNTKVQLNESKDFDSLLFEKDLNRKCSEINKNKQEADPLEEQRSNLTYIYEDKKLNADHNITHEQPTKLLRGKLTSLPQIDTEKNMEICADQKFTDENLSKQQSFNMLEKNLQILQEHQDEKQKINLKEQNQSQRVSEHHMSANEQKIHQKLECQNKPILREVYSFKQNAQITKAQYVQQGVNEQKSEQDQDLIAQDQQFKREGQKISLALERNSNYEAQDIIIQQCDQTLTIKDEVDKDLSKKKLLRSPEDSNGDQNNVDQDLESRQKQNQDKNYQIEQFLSKNSIIVPQQQQRTQNIQKIVQENHQQKQTQFIQLENSQLSQVFSHRTLDQVLQTQEKVDLQKEHQPQDEAQNSNQDQDLHSEKIKEEEKSADEHLQTQLKQFTQLNKSILGTNKLAENQTIDQLSGGLNQRVDFQILSSHQQEKDQNLIQTGKTQKLQTQDINLMETSNQTNFKGTESGQQQEMQKDIKDNQMDNEIHIQPRNDRERTHNIKNGSQIFSEKKQQIKLNEPLAHQQENIPLKILVLELQKESLNSNMEPSENVENNKIFKQQANTLDVLIEREIDDVYKNKDSQGATNEKLPNAQLQSAFKNKNVSQITEKEGNTATSNKKVLFKCQQQKDIHQQKEVQLSYYNSSLSYREGNKEKQQVMSRCQIVQKQKNCDQPIKPEDHLLSIKQVQIQQQQTEIVMEGKEIQLKSNEDKICSQKLALQINIQIQDKIDQNAMNTVSISTKMIDSQEQKQEKIQRDINRGLKGQNIEDKLVQVQSPIELDQQQIRKINNSEDHSEQQKQDQRSSVGVNQLLNQSRKGSIPQSNQSKELNNSKKDGTEIGKLEIATKQTGLNYQCEDLQDTRNQLQSYPKFSTEGNNNLMQQQRESITQLVNEDEMPQCPTKISNSQNQHVQTSISRKREKPTDKLQQLKTNDKQSFKNQEIILSNNEEQVSKYHQNKQNPCFNILEDKNKHEVGDQITNEIRNQQFKLTTQCQQDPKKDQIQQNIQDCKQKTQQPKHNSLQQIQVEQYQSQNQQILRNQVDIAIQKTQKSNVSSNQEENNKQSLKENSQLLTDSGIGKINSTDKTQQQCQSVAQKKLLNIENPIHLQGGQNLNIRSDKSQTNDLKISEKDNNKPHKDVRSLQVEKDVKIEVNSIQVQTQSIVLHSMKQLPEHQQQLNETQDLPMSSLKNAHNSNDSQRYNQDNFRGTKQVQKPLQNHFNSKAESRIKKLVFKKPLPVAFKQVESQTSSQHTNRQHTEVQSPNTKYPFMQSIKNEPQASHIQITQPLNTVPISKTSTICSPSQISAPVSNQASQPSNILEQKPQLQPSQEPISEQPINKQSSCKQTSQNAIKQQADCEQKLEQESSPKPQQQNPFLKLQSLFMKKNPSNSVQQAFPQYIPDSIMQKLAPVLSQSPKHNQINQNNPSSNMNLQSLLANLNNMGKVTNHPAILNQVIRSSQNNLDDQIIYLQQNITQNLNEISVNAVKYSIKFVRKYFGEQWIQQKLFSLKSRQVCLFVGQEWKIFSYMKVSQFQALQSLIDENSNKKFSKAIQNIIIYIINAKVLVDKLDVIKCIQILTGVNFKKVKSRQHELSTEDQNKLAKKIKSFFTLKTKQGSQPLYADQKLVLRFDDNHLGLISGLESYKSVSQSSQKETSRQQQSEASLKSRSRKNQQILSYTLLTSTLHHTELTTSSIFLTYLTSHIKYQTLSVASNNINTFQLYLGNCMLVVSDAQFRFILYRETAKDKYQIVKDGKGFLKFSAPKEKSVYLMIVQPLNKKKRHNQNNETTKTSDDKDLMKNLCIRYYFKELAQEGLLDRLIQCLYSGKGKSHEGGYENDKNLYLPVQKIQQSKQKPSNKSEITDQQI